MRSWKFFTLTAAVVAATLVSSCGGGSGSGGATVAADALAPQEPVDLAAAAATFGFIDDGTAGGGGDSGGGDGGGGAGGGAGDGAPLKKAVIVVTDATGKSVSGLTDINGIYFVRFTGFKSPIVAKVIDAGGNVLTSVTEETVAPGKAVRININPLTDKIVSDVVVSGTVPGTDKNFDGSKIDVSKLAQARKDLIASVSAALASVGITNTAFDPIKSVYAYDGTGVDTIIESITHTRDAQTGRTVLRPKLVSVDTAITTEISAASPLTTSAVSTSNSPVLTYGKLNNWINVMNSCLALDPNTLPNSTCPTLVNNLISSNYLNNSMDIDESFKTLVSYKCGSTFCHVPGSTMRNPVLLYVGKYGGSTASFDDLAAVEITIRQPLVGTYYDTTSSTFSFPSPIEYTKTVIFKRDDSLSGAAAGNWILAGNQRNYDFSVEARYDKYVQTNPARAGNNALTSTTGKFILGFNPSTATSITASLPAGTFLVSVSGSTSTGNYSAGLDDPSIYASGIRTFFNPTKFDIPSRKWVSANVLAAKITGPGLPAAGLVLVNNNSSVCGGNTYLTIANASGIMPTTPASFTTTFSGGNEYTLASVLASDGVTAPWYSISQGAFSNRAKPNITDFSSLSAFGRYQADIFLGDGTTVTEFTRIQSAVESPSNLASAQWNDVSPSLPLVSSPAINSAASAFNVQWLNNANAAFVESVVVSSGAFTATNSFRNWNQTAGVQGSAALAARPTSQNSGYPTDTVCAANGQTQYPALSNINDRRIVGLRSYQARSRRYNTVSWRN